MNACRMIVEKEALRLNISNQHLNTSSLRRHTLLKVQENKLKVLLMNRKIHALLNASLTCINCKYLLQDLSC